MRTRSQSNRREEEKSTGDTKKSHSTSDGEEGSLAAISKNGIGKLLERARKRKKGEDKKDDLPSENGQSAGELSQNLGSKDCIDGDAERIMLSKGGNVEGSSHCNADELDWEEGTIYMDNHSHEHGGEVTVEFTDSPASAQRKPFRRASAEAKELAELVHKVHLLCLLARGRLVDSACNDPLIQASLLSLLPSYLLKITEIPRLEANMLQSLVNWFHNYFHVRIERTDRGSFHSNLAFALETREGTAEELAALSVALFRALNLGSRYVSILDVSSLKPDTEVVRVPHQDAPRLDTRIGSSPTAMSSPNQGNALHPAQLSETQKLNDAHQLPRSKLDRKDSSTSCRKKLLEGFTGSIQSGDETTHATKRKEHSGNSHSCLTKSPERSKRKGDLEFDLQMEMALSATGSGAHDSKLHPASDELQTNSSSTAPPLKRLKETEVKGSPVSTSGSSSAVWSRKVGPPLYWAEVYCSGETYSGRWVHIDAVNGIVNGEEKIEAALAACRRPLKYVGAFAGNGAKDVTRRYCLQWYKVAPRRINPQWWDSVLAPLKELESGATAGMVQMEALQTNTSSDMERKCSGELHPIDEQSSKIKCSSFEEYGENKTLAGGPSKEAFKERNKACNLEPPPQFPTCYTGISLEDLELETRALTEPLPTNQQAYKNHHLYAIERWLTQRQVLHPRGPVLGYCAGHPVYPRSCIQSVQTKHRWLCEGFQVKANEVPAKILKKSRKYKKVQISEPSISEEDDGETTIELYGKWQLELLQLPHAVNGIVPKNERGRVDVWSEKCLPPGTVHLKLPRIASVARRLDIDFAPAMVGFEFRNGRSAPVFEGIVVCTEFREAIMEAYEEEEARREAEEKKHNEAQTLSRWYQLLSSIITRQRLENSYVDSTSLYTQQGIATDRKDRFSSQNSSSEGCKPSRGTPQGLVPKLDLRAADGHEHVFPLENQSFDEESMICTKRCLCGFTMEVEEL